jgi:membrane protein DedA with SNARE-associated domain
MGLARFFFFNLIGSLTWAVVLGWAGYLFGQSLEAIAKGIRLGEVGFALVLAGLLIIYFLNSRRKKKNPGKPS